MTTQLVYKRHRLLLLAGVIFLLLSGPARGAKKHTFIAQGGWPYVEAEVLSRWNAYGNLGLHWGDFLSETHYQYSHWLLPIHAAAGAQWKLNDFLRLRTGLRFLVSIEMGHQRIIDEPRAKLDVRVLLELGLRIELENGLVAGVQLPVFGVRERAYFPPRVLQHTYAYLGYAWWF
jgi:hypothetical protein